MRAEYIKETITKEIEEFMERINVCYKDKRGKRHAREFITNLLKPIERKNGWQMAEACGAKTPYAIQQFIYRGNWSANEVRNKMSEYVKEQMGTEDAVLIVDETGFLKKGKKSAGVMRQYSGTAGRIENCQVGVFLTYAAKENFTMIDRELYIPKEWMNDPERCKEAGIPETVTFRTKPQMALEMLKTAESASIPYSWVTADCLYGDFTDIRQWLESIEKGYVMAVSGKAYVWKGYKQHKVSTILNALPDDGWQRASAGCGSKGERYYDWLIYELNAPHVGGWSKYLLVRRSVSAPEEVRAFICFCPEATTLGTLASVAGIRWSIEQSFAETKGEVGLDHYEVRSYTGWYKHITLACCAHVLLTVMKKHVQNDRKFQIAIETNTVDSMHRFKKGRNL